ncbi:MAG TPA: LCP family protein [Anaerolineaceae bacterium]|nr:LCP family protein [Anaerolineaceae bacterium]
MHSDPFRHGRRRWPLLTGALVCALLWLAACNMPGQPPANPPAAAASPVPSVTRPTGPTPSATPSLIPTLTPYPTVHRPPRRPYPTPRFTPATPVPAPVSGIQIPSEVHVLALLGSDQAAPFVGRTEAVMLVFYHPRLAQAAVLSLPPDLFVYIPGETMQRLSTAFALGGFDRFAETIEFNFGVRPDQYLLVNTDTLASFVDDIGGVQVTLLVSYPDQCGGLPAGERDLSGEMAVCYLSFRYETDELARMVRQQEVLHKLFERMTHGGGLVRVPGLYNAYRGDVQTNLSASDAAGAVPLLLRVADPGHLGFFQLAYDGYREWRLPGALGPVVFLPDPDHVRSLVQAAVDFASVPAPFSETVLTLEAELTISPTPTITRTPTPTATVTPTVPFSPTPSPSETATVTLTPAPPTATLTATLPGYP